MKDVKSLFDNKVELDQNQLNFIESFDEKKTKISKKIGKLNYEIGLEKKKLKSKVSEMYDLNKDIIYLCNGYDTRSTTWYIKFYKIVPSKNLVEEITLWSDRGLKPKGIKGAEKAIYDILYKHNLNYENLHYRVSKPLGYFDDEDVTIKPLDWIVRLMDNYRTIPLTISEETYLKACERLYNSMRRTEY